MNIYTVTGPMCRIGPGAVLKLTAEQYRRRSHLVAPQHGESGMYITNHPVVFKQGETFGIDGEVDKTFMDAVATVGGGVPEAASGKGNSKTKKSASGKGKPKPGQETASASKTAAPDGNGDDNDGAE